MSIAAIRSFSRTSITSTVSSTASFPRPTRRRLTRLTLNDAIAFRIEWGTRRIGRSRSSPSGPISTRSSGSARITRAAARTTSAAFSLAARPRAARPALISARMAGFLRSRRDGGPAVA
ncbi:MAG TPA: hypothetical protein VKE74_30045 [Gemmataceae bacterium]|nr:hypothetical protein [Gemmataceae bacterium]